MSGPASLPHEKRQFLPEDDVRRGRAAEVLRLAGIALAVVHGSRARGRARVDSDLDVGVLAADGQPLSYAVLGTLALDLSNALSMEVDVSDLSTPDAVFRYEVVGCALLLFQDRPDAFTDFVARALIDYSDIQRFLPKLVAGVARGPKPRGKEASPRIGDHR